MSAQGWMSSPRQYPPVPAVVIFILRLIQRHLVAGMSAGAVNGWPQHGAGRPTGPARRL